MAVILCLLLALGFASRVFSTRLDGLSFQGPFKSVDSKGQRQVSNGWRVSGSTVVNQNFVRLTPDRQSKRGALWSVGSINTPKLGGILKFRISGQGSQFFGDGIALWITSDAAWREGEFHGTQERFNGVAVIMDTFKNLEYAFAHRGDL